MTASNDTGEALPRYGQADFDGEKPPCDLIMKGGITSGVVYPFAITELAREHRFVSIGGTSAGAIAAGIAAAAELGRSKGGFLRLAKIPDDVSQRLLSLFQPAPRYRSVFRTFLSGLGDRSALAKAGRLVISALWNHPFATLLGVAPGIMLAWPGILQSMHLAAWVVVALMLALGPLLAVTASIGLNLFRGLPRTLFGVCPGLRQPGEKMPGLTDWLADTLEEVAGRKAPDGALPARPLTFGDLKDEGIDLNVMTTNLSMRRPHRLPADMNTFYWSPEDFEKLFPEWVMRHLLSVCVQEPLPGCSQARCFPKPDDLPVIVAVRMSLSFPVLLAAVPLYTRDYTYRLSEEEQNKARLCWFSDGGISSNFPIHFFDNLWPSHPTFAITLDAHHPLRHGPEDVIEGNPEDDTESEGVDKGRGRVHMPQKAGGGVLLPVLETGGLVSFISAILGTAKDWQDVLQGTLSGYRERIAHVALTSDEGGLNLTMPEERVRLLSRFGYLAGREMHGFDFDEHRWRRYLVALARIEETLHELSTNYDETYRDFLKDYADRARSYSQPPGWIEEALANTDALMTIAAKTVDVPLRDRGRIPRPETDMRISPKM